MFSYEKFTLYFSLFEYVKNLRFSIIKDNPERINENWPNISTMIRN